MNFALADNRRNASKVRNFDREKPEQLPGYAQSVNNRHAAIFNLSNYREKDIMKDKITPAPVDPYESVSERGSFRIAYRKGSAYKKPDEPPVKKYFVASRWIRDSEIELLNQQGIKPHNSVGITIVFAPPKFFDIIWPRGCRSGRELRGASLDALWHFQRWIGYDPNAPSRDVPYAVFHRVDPPEVNAPRQSFNRLLRLVHEYFCVYGEPLYLRKLAVAIRRLGYARWPSCRDGLPHTVASLKPWLRQAGVEPFHRWDGLAGPFAVMESAVLNALEYAGRDRKEVEAEWQRLRNTQSVWVTSTMRLFQPLSAVPPEEYLSAMREVLERATDNP